MNKINSKSIVIDLRKFLLHREPHPENKGFQYFILTKFVQPG
jgi:hypothetical protein